MKSHSTVLVLVLILSLSSLISIANASSITKEYDADLSFEYGHTSQTILTFHVEMIIETEADGKWKSDTFYQIDYIISLTYLNESIIGNQEFGYLFFHDPLLLINDWILGTGKLETVANSTRVWFGHTGTETLRYSINGGNRIQLKPMLNYQVFNSTDKTIFESLDWHSTEPIWMDLESVTSPSPDYITPLLYVAIGVVIAAVPAAIYLFYKSRKTSKKDRTVQQKEPLTMSLVQGLALTHLFSVLADDKRII